MMSRQPARRLAFAALVALAVAGVAGFLGVGIAAIGAARENAALAGLAANRDVPAGPGSPLRVVEARAAWLLGRDQIEQAEALGPLIVASADARAMRTWYYNLGNARLRRGFELIEVRNLDDAEPQVALAKVAYRAALRAEPGFWQGKVNLDLAMRIVRDLPREEQEASEDEAPPKALWTDLPGLPGGAP